MSLPLMSLSLTLIFDRVAQSFGATQPEMRARNPSAHEARLVYCYLAHGLLIEAPLRIGMVIARDAVWVGAAIEETARRMLADPPAFRQKICSIEIECLAEAGLADRTDYPLPRCSNPHDVATRLAGSPRDATLVGLADLQTIGAAYLALERQYRRERIDAEERDILKAVRDHRLALCKLESARYSPREAAAKNLSNATLQTLLERIPGAANQKNGTKNNGE